jgi:DNA mismatch repair protein MLH3
MSIRPLPRHVAEQIRTSVIVTSLNDVVSGLLKNSLDAGASAVNVHLDYPKSGCTVEDDGLGIPPAEFYPEGGLGKAHRA